MGIGVATLLALGAFPTPAGGASGIADGGFESGFLAGPNLPPMPYAFGHWEAETPDGRLVRSPVHAGIWAAVVDTMNATNGGVIIQDFDSGTASYDLVLWVYPVQGIEGGGLVYNWDRGMTGARDAGSMFSFTRTATGFGAWDTSLTLAPITFETWHRVEIVADKCKRTQDLYIDGIAWGSVTATPAATIPSGNATIYFGDGAWIANHGHFYWDDIAISYWDCGASGPPDYVLANPNPGGPVVAGLSMPVTLSIEVSSAGGSAPQNATASILAFANGTSPASPFATASGRAIPAGSSAGPFTATWNAPAVPGRYLVSAFADSTDVVEESNETNNAYTWTIDVVPGPFTVLRVGAPNYTAGATFVTSRTQLRLAVTDNGGMGILRTMYRVDGSGWTDAPGAFALVNEGARHLEWYSEDRAGNVEPSRSGGVIVDDTPPVTSMTPDGDAVPASAAVTLAASDTASGVDHTEYRMDDGAWMMYSAGLRLSPGTHRLGFRSVDRVGNVEAERARVFTVAAEMNDKPFVAAFFACALAGVGAWSARRAPWTRRSGQRSGILAFAAASLPFVLAEAATGIASHVTGVLSIPPILGLGTAVDAAILVLGLAASLGRVRRVAPAPPPSTL